MNATTPTTTDRYFRLLMTQVSKFNRLGTARSFAGRGTKFMAIMHGDDDLFWVVKPGVALELEAVGYEIIEYVR